MASQDKTGGRTPEARPWPDALDAVIAAPKHHALLLENEHVRVLDTRKQRRAGTPRALWSEPLPPHTLENVDTRPIHVVSVELKR